MTETRVSSITIFNLSCLLVSSELLHLPTYRQNYVEKIEMSENKKVDMNYHRSISM